jgi:hypothetical protein
MEVGGISFTTMSPWISRLTFFGEGAWGASWVGIISIEAAPPSVEVRQAIRTAIAGMAASQKQWEKCVFRTWVCSES